MIEVELPDGSIAEFPDGTPDDVIKNVLQREFPPAQSVAPGTGDREMGYGETAMDMLKSAGTGLAKGVMGLGGAVGDVQQMAGGIVGWGANKLGASPETQEMASGIASRMAVPGFAMQAPTSGQIQQTAEGFTGPMYQPKTTAGEYSQTIGEFAPGAVMGPGGVARKAALAVVPAVASETAGQVAQSYMPSAEPLARVGGALLGGSISSLPGRGQNPMKAMREAAPSFDDNAAAVNAAYGDLRAAGIVYDPNAYKSFAMKVQSDLRKHGLLAEDTGPIADDLRKIMARTKKLNGFTELDSLRQSIGNLPATASAKDIARAEIIKGHMDDLIASGKAISTRGLPPEQIGPMVRKARDLARRNILARQINDMDDARLGYLSGDESAMRNQFGTYLRGRKRRGLSDTEKDAFAKVVRREGPLNAAHMLGSRWGQIAGGSGSSVVGGLLGSFLGPVGTAVGAVAGPVVNFGVTTAARAGMNKMTDKAVKDALKTVLAGREAQAKAAKAAKMKSSDLRTQSLLAGGSGVLSTRQEPMVMDAKGNAYPYALLGR